MRSNYPFLRRLVMLIGSGQFARTEQLIRFFANRLDVLEVISALDRPIDLVRIEDWDTLGARMAYARRYLHGDDKGRDWRAVILELWNDSSSNGLHVKTRFALSDDRPPSLPPLQTLTERQARRVERFNHTQANLPHGATPTPDTSPLRLLGLEDLYSLELGQVGEWSQRRECVQDIAAAAILLRFHQAVERHAMEDGLPSLLPIYATVAHLARPMEMNVHEFSAVARRRLEPVVGDFTARTAELVAAATRQEEANYLRQTRRLVSQMREMDGVLARWPHWHNPFKRHSFARDVQLEQGLTRDLLHRMYGIDAANLDREQLIRRLVEARHGHMSDALLEELPAHDRSDLHQIRMAYAKKFGGRKVRAYLMAHPDHPPIIDQIVGA